MKRFVLFLLLGFIISGCHEREDALEIQILGGPVGKIILTANTPFSKVEGRFYDAFNYYFIEVDSSGQDFVVTASFPAEEGVTLNDSFITAWSHSSIPDNQVVILHKKENAYQSSYSISVAPNKTGIEYDCFIMLFDNSRLASDGSGKHIPSQATLVIRQKAE